MKIAILFRGPIRPNPQSVIDRYTEFMNQFINVVSNSGPIVIHTYLATWRNWKNHNASDLLSLNLFNNVLMQEEPVEETRTLCTKIQKLPNGADIIPVYNMYYQSKMALNLIENSNNYDYVIHTRTDAQVILNQFIPEWFDSNNYVAPHVHPEPWMNDQFGIAPAKLMYSAWDYGTIENLGKMIESADIPERVLEFMMRNASIPVKAGKYVAFNLDPNRNI